MVGFWPATVAVTRGGWWQQRLQEGPFGVGGVGGVAPGAVGWDRRRRCVVACEAADWHAGSWGNGLVW
jgi:hypothetical protein